MKVNNTLLFAQILLIISSVMFNPEIIQEDTINPLLVESQSQISSKSTSTLLTSQSEPSILKIGTKAFLDFNYDPLTTIYGVDVFRNSLVYDSLLAYDVQSGDLTPSLASQWIVSEDSKHWIFHLRDDVYFHDGSKFNSSSVKSNFERLLDPGNPGYLEIDFWDTYGPDVFPLDSVEIISEYIVIINFFRSYAPFINEHFPIVSPSSFNESGSLVHPIGTGPYMLDLSSSNDTFHNFTRFSYHFRGLAPFDEVHFYILNLEGAEFNEAIQENGINFLPIEIPQEIYSDEEWQVQQINAATTHLMGYFNHLNPVLANQDVRKAINHAINRSYLIDTLFEGDGTPMRSLFPPGTPFTDETLQGFPFNLSIANNLLDEAGFIKGSDGYRFSVDLVGTTLLTNCTKLLNIISENLRAIGIQTTIDLDHDYSRWFNGEYDIYIIGSGGITDPSVIRDYLHSESVMNTGKYNNTLMDELLIRGETTPIKQEREYYYSLVQSLVEFDAPVLFVNYLKEKFSLAKNLTNLVQIDKSLKIVFNYTYSSGNSKLYRLGKNNKLNEQYEYNLVHEYEDFAIPEYAVYFPDADTVFTPIGHVSGTVTVTMTDQLSNVVQTRTGEGKYISVTVSNEDVEYYLRCYYDNGEITNFSSINELGLQQWNENEEFWANLKTVNSNQSLRFVEVKAKGDIIIQFGEILDIARATFQYLPLAMFLTLITGGTVFFIVYWNFKQFQQLKERFKL